MIKKINFVLLSIIVTIYANSLKNDLKQVKTCNNGRGELVPFYQCKDGKINKYGENNLELRLPEETDDINDFEVCCDVEEQHVANCGTKKFVAIPLFESAEILDNVTRPDVDAEQAFDVGQAEYGEFPWMVAVFNQELIDEDVANLYLSGASLIAHNVVLTAAYSIEGKNISRLRIRVGEWNIQTENELYLHSDYEVDKVVIHEKFYKGGLHNDIALLFLKTNVKMTEVVNTICLPAQDQIIDSKRCFVSGWGKDQFGKDGNYSAVLKKVELPTVPHDNCQAKMRKTRLGRRFELHESFMCAGGEEGKDACQGDGGSPLVCPVDGESDMFYQAGIVAWGIGCGKQDLPGVYVNVAKFRSWIDQQIELYTREVMINDI